MFKAIYGFITGVLDFIKKYFFILLVIVIISIYSFNSSKSLQYKPNLMRINIVGPILQSDTFLQDIKEANQENIRGVLVYINSPGGLVAPSVEMSLAIKRLKMNKPVVVYAAGVMASGSYYAGIWADKIVANPGAIIGSIGVIYDGLNLSELAKKIGIKEQVLKVGKYKEAGTFARPWNKDEKAELKRVLDDTYSMFVNDVARARGLNIANKNQFADAHIFSASRAQAVGLVDQVGSIYKAKELLIKESGVVYPRWKKRAKYETYIDRLIGGTVSKVSSYFTGIRSSL